MTVNVQVFQETHRILAGFDFTGELPAAPYVIKHGHAYVPPNTKGGLFALNLNNIGAPASVEGMHGQGMFRLLQGLRIKFGGQASWTLNIVSERASYLFLTGTVETNLVLTSQDAYLVLAPDEYLVLVTIGASTEMAASVIFEAWRQVS